MTFGVDPVDVTRRQPGFESLNGNDVSHTRKERDMNQVTRIIDWDRDETDPCQKNTPGCCIDHDAESERDGFNDAVRYGRRFVEGSCETW